MWDLLLAEPHRISQLRMILHLKEHGVNLVKVTPAFVLARWCGWNDPVKPALTPPDCQQQAGLSAWVPFHESASAVTQLYKGRVVYMYMHVYACIYVRCTYSIVFVFLRKHYLPSLGMKSPVLGAKPLEV